MHIIHLATIFTGVLFLYLAYRTRSFTKALFALRRQNIDKLEKMALDAKNPKAWPKLSLVIPARDEGLTIEAATKSLLKIQYPNLEIVFVDDRSVDQTGVIMDRVAAANPHVKVIHVKDLPKNWLGKVHAMHCGVAATSGDWVLMTDADVHFSEKSLKKAIAYSLENNLDFLTVIPDLLTPTFSLQLMMVQLFHQATIFFNPKKINDPNQKISYGMGAFLMFKRSTYERSEGLEWIKMEVVDDSGFALVMRRAGGRLGCVSGRKEISVEWYPTLRSMLCGLEKNAFAVCQYSMTYVLTALSVTWMIFLGFTLLPVLSKSWGYVSFSFGCIFLYLLAVEQQIKSLMQVRLMSIVLFPVSFVLLPLIFLRAAILAIKRNGIQWRGTFYSLEDLKANQRMKMVNLVFAKEDVQSNQLAYKVK